MYDIEALYEADSPDHAIELLAAHPGARIIAGGSDLLIKIREGELAGCTLVSIRGLDELRGVSLESGGAIRIGPLTSFSHVARDPLIQKHIPVLAEAVETIGGPQLRNIGTIGGNVCNGVTSADSASTLVAYEAVMEYRGPGGVRRLPIGEHYTGPGKTSLGPSELLQGIVIPQESYENCYGHYIKYAMRNALDIATLGCSVNLRLSDDRKTIERARIACGVAGPVPLRVKGAEEAARGKPVAEETVRAAAKAALDDVSPRTSWRATREFRLHLVEELIARALRVSIRRAGGNV
jgi:xanthine dehydrogenase FAD-binding subunit